MADEVVTNTETPVRAIEIPPVTLPRVELANQERAQLVTLSYGDRIHGWLASDTFVSNVTRSFLRAFIITFAAGLTPLLALIESQGQINAIKAAVVALAIASGTAGLRAVEQALQLWLAKKPL